MHMFQLDLIEHNSRNHNGNIFYYKRTKMYVVVFTNHETMLPSCVFVCVCQM